MLPIPAIKGTRKQLLNHYYIPGPPPECQMVPLQGVNSPSLKGFDWHTTNKVLVDLHGIFVKCIFGKHHPRKLQTFASGLI